MAHLDKTVFLQVRAGILSKVIDKTSLEDIKAK